MWIVVAIVAYFFLAVVAVLDKYLLVGPLPNPKLYAFAIGIFGAVSFVLIPFGFLEIPSSPIILLGLVAGILQIFAILALFIGLKAFETSRIIPAIGGFLPLFTIVFTVVLQRGVFATGEVLAFVLLVAGSVLVSVEKSRFVTRNSVLVALVTAFLFSLFVVSSKFVYEAQPFLSGLLWIMMGSFIAAVVLLVFGELRTSLWGIIRKRGAAKKALSPLVIFLFVFNQVLSALGFVLQNWAVALAPFAYIAFVNALEGVKYVFVFALASILSVTFPNIIQERLGALRITQKLVAISLIAAGLVLVAL